MSRIWKNPIVLPSWVSLENKDNLIKVTGPKWNLQFQLPKDVSLKQEDNNIVVSLENKESRPLWGTMRTIVANMVKWVTEWYQKQLLVFWVGYWAKLQGDKLVLSLWLSHTVDFPLPAWVTAAVAKDPKWSDIITLTWIDKYQVGQTAANLKSLKRLDPYKWKGIRYIDEVIKLKVGKTSKK